MSVIFSMPRQGEAWRHYKGGYDSLYTIVGVGPDSDGIPTVAYTPHHGDHRNAPIYFQRLERFLQHVEPPGGFSSVDGHNPKPRFAFDREPDTSERSRYIGPRPTPTECSVISNYIAMLASAVKCGSKWDDTLEEAKNAAFLALALR